MERTFSTDATSAARFCDYIQPPAEVIAEFMAHPKGL
jgi:hypothetical protein